MARVGAEPRRTRPPAPALPPGGLLREPSRSRAHRSRNGSARTNAEQALPRVAAPLERRRTSSPARLGRGEECHRDRFLAEPGDRVLGPVEHGNAVADRPPGPSGNLRREHLLSGRADRPIRRWAARWSRTAVLGSWG